MNEYQSGGSNVFNPEDVNTSSHPNYSISAEMVSNDANGNVTFRFKATDDAGNQTNFISAVTDGSSVTYDKTPPSITNRTITSDNSDSDFAKEGDEITLAFRITETLLNTPSVSFAVGATQ